MTRRLIEELEHRTLEGKSAQPVKAESLLNDHAFVRVAAVDNFWEEAQSAFWHRVEDLVTAAHAHGSYLTFVLTGDDQKIGLYLALNEGESVRSLLRAAYPGVEVSGATFTDLGSQLKGRFKYSGMISGVPALFPGKEMEEDQHHPQLERIVHGARNMEWAYVVQAYPRSRDEFVRERNSLLGQLSEAASQVRQQRQRTMQATKSRTEYESAAVSQVEGEEIVNREAEYAVTLLERQLERIERALGRGPWQAGIYFGATRPAAVRQLASLLLGTLSGEQTQPQPLRIHYGESSASAPHHHFHTYLSSAEVARLLPVLREEVPGYAVHDRAGFDVDYGPPSGKKLTLGAIQWEGHETGTKYQIKQDDLARHGVVCGVTGSGKTTTLLGLLYGLRTSRPPVPFLVIEPAKTEYRALVGPVRSGRPAGPVPDLRIYTLGNDTLAPFRLNPFEFELGKTPGSVPVLSHIDYLKAVFNAAFILYAPMPYVLETALHKVYEEKGWNLATGENVRFPAEMWETHKEYPLFPTLTDLYHKVEAVTARLGYEARIEQDVIAGLKARIGALRLGAKGLMLDTPRGVSMETMLEQPTVVELEDIGNDEEKTFLMGLLLARLYGYRRVQAAEGKLPAGLQHVLVVEEAHRLLKHVDTAVATEAANLRAQAVETFANILSEVRHYGQGVLVAEQIPAKLAPDVIKNSNLKVVHRLLAEDDRASLGTSMNMSETQMRRFSTLMPGEAVVSAQGDDHPHLISVENFKKRRHLEAPRDKEITELAKRYISLEPYLPVLDLADYNVRMTTFDRPDPIIYQEVRRYLSLPAMSQLWAQIIARTIFERPALTEALQRLRQLIASRPGHLGVAQHAEALRLLLVLGAAEAIMARGNERGWSYPEMETMQRMLSAGLTTLAQTRDLQLAATELDRFVRAYEANMKEQSWGPFPGCSACRSICLYRSEVQRLLSKVELGQLRNVLADTGIPTREQRYDQFAQQLRTMVKRWLGGKGSEEKDVAYCTGLVAAPLLRLDEYEQGEVAHEIARRLLV